MHTHDDVLKALHDLELKNPNVLLNIPESDKRGKKRIPKDLISGSPVTTKYPHIKTFRDCILKCRQDGEALDKILFEKSRVYVKTPDRNNHCFYQSVLTSLHDYIKGSKNLLQVHCSTFKISNDAASIKEYTQHRTNEIDICQSMV